MLGDRVPPPFTVLPDMLDEQLVLLRGPRPFPPPVHLLPCPRELPIHCRAARVFWLLNRKLGSFGSNDRCVFLERYLCCRHRTARLVAFDVSTVGWGSSKPLFPLVLSRNEQRVSCCRVYMGHRWALFSLSLAKATLPCHTNSILH
jgi:hypothetical protein